MRRTYLPKWMSALGTQQTQRNTTDIDGPFDWVPIWLPGMSLTGETSQLIIISTSHQSDRHQNRSFSATEDYFCLQETQTVDQNCVALDEDRFDANVKQRSGICHDWKQQSVLKRSIVWWTVGFRTSVCETVSYQSAKKCQHLAGMQLFRLCSSCPRGLQGPLWLCLWHDPISWFHPSGLLRAHGWQAWRWLVEGQLHCFWSNELSLWPLLRNQKSNWTFNNTHKCQDIMGEVETCYRILGKDRFFRNEHSKWICDSYESIRTHVVILANTLPPNQNTTRSHTGRVSNLFPSTLQGNVTTSPRLSSLSQSSLNFQNDTPKKAPTQNGRLLNGCWVLLSTSST